MAMGVSLTSHNNPLLRHLSPSSSCVSRSSLFSSYPVPCRRTLQRKVASTEGNVGFSTTTVCQGFQHSGHQRSSSVVFNGEWELRSESNKVRMVPKIIKVGNQPEVAETHNVPGNVSAWREEAKKVRERNGQIARNLDDSCSFNGSVPVISNAPTYETSQKIDYGFMPRGNSTATLNKESFGATQSGPVVTLPSKSLEVGADMDVNPKGEETQRPLISGKSSGTASSNETAVAISKVEKSNEPSKVRANLRNLADSCSFNGSVLVISNAPTYETSQKIDYGFMPRGNSTATLNKESFGVTQSGPVVTLPSKSLEVGANMDVNPKGEETQRPLISGKSSGTASSNETTVAISKVEKSNEPSKVRAKLRNLDDSCSFNGSVLVISNAPTYETSQKIDYGFTPRGNSTATLNKESFGVTQSGPVVTLPSKSLEVGANMDVNPKGEETQRSLISGKSSGTASSNETTVAISKVEKSNEPSKVRANLRKIYDKVLVVDNVPTAKNTVSKLVNQYRNLVHSCDTEVSGIKVKEETPVDHGELICFSIYCGPDTDFDNGKSCIWVDVLGENGREVLAEFKPYFEDSSIRKVWHNYSFDSHIIRNHGIEISGFHADTMHMARLWDSARRTEGGYSLEALTSDPKVLGATQTKEEADFLGKISMKTIFGKRKLKKDGSEGKLVVIPPVEELQREDREAWISYSALDAISTLKLYESMTKKLQLMDWRLDGKPVLGRTMLDFYHEFWRPFGELLVQMEAEGVLVDREYLAEIEKLAKVEQQVAVSRFHNWASKYCPDAKHMNVGSDTQLRQLFFGGISNSVHGDVLPAEKLFKIPNIDKVIEEGKKTPTKFRNIKLHRIGDSPLSTENFTASGLPSLNGEALKALAGKVSAEYDFMEDVSDISLEDVAEDDDLDQTSETQKSKTDDETDTSAYGTAYVAFGGGERGKEACHAIASLCEVCSIDSLISNFILPLQGSNVSGKDGRVHCSLNINTETGRLSARRPNLQNQPALEKDRYKIRKAFVASPGNTLIVADYGQLELRILAHLTGCKSMMEAFKAGGDFHSRTAMNMYPHIREAVENGQVLLEWHPQPGEDKPPVPLLKDAFGSERRKAKMLNFSIAYGKTAIGLSKDWKVSIKEARDTVNLWYNDRQEVRKWQEMRKEEATKDRYVLTLLGRARRFPAYHSPAQKNHIQRAAINTPVQGSAADVAMCAMLEISTNQQLKKLGWRLLLQIHDEVILEGPTESAEIAKEIVVDCMSKPFDGRNILSVDLSVDAKCAQNWYAAK